MRDTAHHDRVIELLPWLVNGTLPADERREVEEHLAECADCRGELVATRAAFELHATHLPAEALVAHVEAPRADRHRLGDGSAVERETVEAHLAACPACREELEMVRESLAAVEEGAGAEAADAGERSADTADTADTAVTPFRRPARDTDRVEESAPRAPGRRSLALAASLLLAVLALGAWFLAGRELDASRQRMAELEQALETAREELQEQSAAVREEATADAEALKRLRQADRQIEQLRRQVGEFSRRLESADRRIAELATERPVVVPGVPYEIPTPAQPEVLRGPEAEAPAAEAVSKVHPFYLAPPVDPGRLGDLDVLVYRLLGPEGEELAAGQVSVIRDPEVGAYVSLMVWPDNLPVGQHTLVLESEGGREVGRFLYRLGE